MFLPPLSWSTSPSHWPVAYYSAVGTCHRQAVANELTGLQQDGTGAKIRKVRMQKSVKED